MKRKIRNELFTWELGILKKSLMINGLWPYKDKFSNIKFMISFGLASCGAIAALFGCFYHEKSESKLFTIFRASLYLHTFMQRCVFKFRRDSLLILFDAMKDNWNYSRFHCSRDRNIMINYAKLTNRLKLLIMFGLSAGTVVWIIAPIATDLRTGTHSRVVFTVSYLSSWELSPNYEIILILQSILTIDGVIVTVTIDVCVIMIMNHCCGQIEILREKIKNYRGIIRHNIISKNNRKIEKLIQSYCSCLKCIIDKHNSIIDFAKVMENCLSELIILQLIPGTVSMCSNGYELFKSYYNNEIAAMIWHIVYIVSVAPIFFIFCWLGDKLLEKSDSIGEAIFQYDWYTLHPKKRRSILMIINRVRRPIKLTGGRILIMSLILYKNWFMNSISYLSVLAVTVPRN